MQCKESGKDIEPNLIKVDGRPVTDWTWMHDSNLSCWEKFHKYYEPEGLFNNYFYVNQREMICKCLQCIYTSKLHQKKDSTLEIKINCKPGKSVGMEWIRDYIHMSKTETVVDSETDEDNSTVTEERIECTITIRHYISRT